jgi:hypothetical protein
MRLSEDKTSIRVAAWPYQDPPPPPMRQEDAYRKAREIANEGMSRLTDALIFLSDIPDDRRLRKSVKTIIESRIGDLLHQYLMV